MAIVGILAFLGMSLVAFVYLVLKYWTDWGVDAAGKVVDLLPAITSAQALANGINGLPCEVGYFLVPFHIPEGMAMAVSAYLTYLAIRMMPFSPYK